MSDGGSGRDRDAPGGRSAGRGTRDFQASVNRLEQAVDELVSSARTEFSDRATTFIDETTDRLERELGRRQGRRSASGRRTRRRERDPEREFDMEAYEEAMDAIPRRLYRDPAHQKIGGVCAGLARYYGVERWVMRCLAVTGLIFFPTIVFPAYWIAYFVMDKPPRPDGSRRFRERHRERHGRHDHGSPAPELGPRLSPRYSLRNVQADLTEVELRLRRMETHVTSGQYELQRELHKIDGGGHESRG